MYMAAENKKMHAPRQIERTVSTRTLCSRTVFDETAKNIASYRCTESIAQRRGVPSLQTWQTCVVVLLIVLSEQELAARWYKLSIPSSFSSVWAQWRKRSTVSAC